MSTPTPSHTAGQALALALEVLRADRQALIDCHSMDGTFPEADELAAQALAQYNQAISALESLQTCRQRALEALRLADAMLRGAHMDAGVVERKVRAAIADLSADPVAEPVQREPLTDEQIASMWNAGYSDVSGESMVNLFARAIERAHGICQQDKGADHA